GSEAHATGPSLMLSACAYCSARAPASSPARCRARAKDSFAGATIQARPLMLAPAPASAFSSSPTREVSLISTTDTRYACQPVRWVSPFHHLVFGWTDNAAVVMRSIAGSKSDRTPSTAAAVAAAL